LTRSGRIAVPPLLRRGTQVAFGLGLLAILWQMADGPEAVRTLSDAEPWWLAMAAVALTAQTMLSAWRWRLTAAQLGIVLSPLHALREYYLAQTINQSLPGGVLGDAGRALRARAQAGLVASGQAVLFERLAGQIAMFALLAAGFFTTLLLPGGLSWPAWIGVPVALVLFAGLSLLVAIRLAARLPGVVGQVILSLPAMTRQVLGRPGVWQRQAALSLGTALCNLAAFAFCAKSIGVALTTGAVFGLVPLILLAMLLPLSISGWGLREGAAAALFPLAGYTAAEGFATSVAFGVVFILATVPGVIPVWLRAKPRPVEQ